ncbi:peroxisomal acyl-CoA oxidase 1A, partial [Thamnocephalis sphaerospora]
LARERSLASFTPRHLTHLLDGSAEHTERVEAVRRILDREPLLDKSASYHLDHEGQYLRALKVMERVRALREEHRWSAGDMNIVWQEIYEGVPSLLNDDLFLKTLRDQATDEQQKNWIPLAKNWAILGCYAQTEMGHGSNVRGIETTATYLPATDELELNTPSLSSIKWWPGALGKTANVAIVFAQLVLADGTRAGVFPFMLQLRSFVDHTLLPGVETGDIGPKIGFNGVDNGYLALRSVRIPRANMLQRHNELTRSGELRRRSQMDQRLVYVTLLYARVNIVAGASTALAQGSTIAVRYSIVRRQFGQDGSTTTESPVLDHQSQQHRVLTPVSEAYAFHFTGQRMLQLYHRLVSAGLAADEAKSLLAESHATASALKAYVTDVTSGSLEQMRRACGGHGYSRFSGMPDLLGMYVQNNTVEGENHVMAQQAGKSRVLIKRYQQLQSSGHGAETTTDYRYMLPVTTEQLEADRCTAMRADEIRDPRVYLHAFERRAAHHIGMLHRRLSQGAPFAECHVDVERIVRAHAELYAVYSFVEALYPHANTWTSASADMTPAANIAPPVHSVLRRLCDLFALSRLVANLGDHLEASYLQSTHGPLARAAVRRLLQELRPDAVALVDAFNIPDRRLGSALGRWDGRVYEAMAAMAQAGPLNRTDVTTGYQ